MEFGVFLKGEKKDGDRTQETEMSFVTSATLYSPTNWPKQFKSSKESNAEQSFKQIR